MSRQHARPLVAFSDMRKLCPEAQATLDALVEERGLRCAARELGCGEALIERLRYGGKATRAAVDAVQKAFYGKDGPYWQALLAGPPSPIVKTDAQLKRELRTMGFFPG